MASTTFTGQVPLWINGEEVKTETSFPIKSPSTGSQLWTSSSASTSEAQQACSAAVAALRSWRKTKPATIQRILLKAADIMESRHAELKDIMMQETGALADFTDFNIVTTVENLRDCAGRAANIQGVIPITKQDGQGAFVFKEPYGVVFGMAPWNAPYILGARAWLYPIVAGNTVVFKGSELSPRSFWAMGKILKDAGLPDGVVNMIYCRPDDAAEVTNCLIEHPAVKKVNFTGSTHVGSIIASKAGKECKPCLMELGGKAAAIVCEDADIEHAAMQAAVGSFLHAGQICMSTERIIVHRSILDSFATALQSATEKIYAPSADAPTLIASAGVSKNQDLRKDAASKGARILYGSKDSSEESPHRLRPVIISDVTKEMDIFYTESFGPTVSLIAVDNDEEAIELANDTEYGLSGAVFTKSLARGLKIAREVESGAVHINSMTVHDESGLPHGGAKRSGFGRFNAQWGIEEFLRLKTVSYMEG